MRILTISDTHSRHNQIPEKWVANRYGDIDTVVHAGDLTMSGGRYEVEEFLKWYSALPFENKLFIAGNHDWFFEEATKIVVEELLAKYPSITYLNDSGVEIDGVKFWGSPVQPWFYNWAFNRLDEAIKPHWDLIPLDTQVLLTHGPVRGYVDLTTRGEPVGCPYLLTKIQELNELKLHVCGHIHEAYGRVEDNGKTFINASVVNSRYMVAYEPLIFEI